MNMMLLTGLSVALALSIMTTNNFYANKVTNTSIKDANNQIETTMSHIIHPSYWLLPGYSNNSYSTHGINNSASGTGTGG